MDRARRSPGPSPARRLAALVVGQVLTVAALVAAADRPPVAGAPVGRGLPHWLATAPPLDAVVVAAHRVALLVALWLLATTLLHVGATLAGVPALVRVTTRAALPGVRRAVTAAVVTAGIMAPLATTGVAAATGSEGRASGVSDGRAAPPAVVVSTAAPTAAPTAPGDHTVVVQPGDSLWSIAERVTAREQFGGEPVGGEHVDVGARWAAICAANAARLRSGDLAVVYPGEEIVIPS